jgi:hypothetical protein
MHDNKDITDVGIVQREGSFEGEGIKNPGLSLAFILHHHYNDV